MNSERMRSLELPGDGQPIAPTAYAETPVIAKSDECDGIGLCWFCTEAERSRLLAALRSHGPAAAPKLQALTGLLIAEIDCHTAEMQRAGLIEAVVAGGMPLVAGGSQVWRAAE